MENAPWDLGNLRLLKPKEAAIIIHRGKSPKSRHDLRTKENCLVIEYTVKMTDCHLLSERDMDEPQTQRIIFYQF